MSCLGAEDLWIIAILFLLLVVLPIRSAIFFIKCKTRWKILVVLLSMGIDVSIVLNESSICKYMTGSLDCSLYLVLGLLAIVPIIVSKTVGYVCYKENKGIESE